MHHIDAENARENAEQVQPHLATESATTHGRIVADHIKVAHKLARLSCMRDTRHKVTADGIISSWDS